MNDILKQAKELKDDLNIRKRFSYKKTTELLEKAKKGCDFFGDSAHVCGNYNWYCQDCQEVIKILKEILE